MREREIRYLELESIKLKRKIRKKKDKEKKRGEGRERQRDSCSASLCITRGRESESRAPSENYCEAFKLCRGMWHVRISSPRRLCRLARDFRKGRSYTRVYVHRVKFETELSCNRKRGPFSL